MIIGITNKIHVMSKEIFIHGNKVVCEDDAKDGATYLERDLDSREADVFFYYARMKRQAAFFEDDRDRGYELTYLGSEEYRLDKK